MSRDIDIDWLHRYPHYGLALVVSVVSLFAPHLVAVSDRSQSQQPS